VSLWYRLSGFEAPEYKYFDTPREAVVFLVKTINEMEDEKRRKNFCEALRLSTKIGPNRMYPGIIGEALKAVAKGAAA
jgi:hypothetical protein